MNKNFKKNLYAKTAVILFVVTAVWFLADRLTKIYFDSGQFTIGQNISDSILGLFHLTLVHNTGAAFGIFANSTIVLAIISFALSAVLLFIPFLFLKNYQDKKIASPLNSLQLFSMAIVIAGGIGNGIDRIVAGYVVDFICFDFIEFPVFNIADIGVTCGIVILLISLFASSFKSKRT